MEDELYEQNVILEGSSSWEAQKKWFQRRIEKLESEIEEMKWKRVEDLKANERVLAIIASKEAAWKREKIQLVQKLEFQRFNNNEDIHIKDESVAEPGRKVINYSRYVAELNCQKGKAETMLRNSLAEMEAWKLKAQEKKHVDAALRSVTDEMLRLQKEMEEKDAFILSQMSKKDTARFRDPVQAELRAKEMELSNAKNRLRLYTDGEGSREREAEKWKRLYLGLKLEFDNLQIYSANAVREEDHSGGCYLAITCISIFSRQKSGEILRSSNVSRGKRVEGNLEWKRSAEMGCLKLGRKAKNKQIEGLGNKRLCTEKKTSKSLKEIKCYRRRVSMC